MEATALRSMAKQPICMWPYFEKIKTDLFNMNLHERNYSIYYVSACQVNLTALLIDIGDHPVYVVMAKS